jgi:hypothetical protein
MKTKVAALALVLLAIGACKAPPGGESKGPQVRAESPTPTPAPGTVIEPAATPAAVTGGPAVLPAGQAQAPAAEPESRTAQSVAPKPEAKRIPAGTKLVVTLAAAVSSAHSQRGDAVIAKLDDDVVVGERVLVRSGAEVRGTVLSAVPSGRVKGRAKLSFVLDRLVVGGRSHPMKTDVVSLLAKSAKGRDAAMVGGGAGAGAIVGAILGGKKGAAVGVVVGAGAGTGAVLATKGHEVELPAGQTITVKLAEPLVLE